MPPVRKPINESQVEINDFIKANEYWVIEGCYSDLINFVIEHATEVIFLNLSIQECIENARNRPWELHKYDSKQAQDANLEMLITWIQDYDKRLDTFSKSALQAIYEQFVGNKSLITSHS